MMRVAWRAASVRSCRTQPPAFPTRLQRGPKRIIAIALCLGSGLGDRLVHDQQLRLAHQARASVARANSPPDKVVAGWRR